MRLIVSILILTLLLGSCGVPEEKASRPDWVIKPEKMTEMLVDLHIVEGARIGRKVMGDTVLIDNYYDKIWEKHHIAKVDFDSSFRYYTNYPLVMDKIYDDVIETLNKMETEESQPKSSGENSSDSTDRKTALERAMKNRSRLFGKDSSSADSSSQKLDSIK